MYPEHVEQECFGDNIYWSWQKLVYVVTQRQVVKLLWNGGFIFHELWNKSFKIPSEIVTKENAHKASVSM